MDAIEFLKGKKRMCRTIACCEICPLEKNVTGISTVCGNEIHYPEEAVAIVEEWSKAHPVQTNWDKFNEIFGGSPIHLIDSAAWWDEPYKAPKEDNK